MNRSDVGSRRAGGNWSKTAPLEINGGRGATSVTADSGANGPSSSRVIAKSMPGMASAASARCAAKEGPVAMRLQSAARSSARDGLEWGPPMSATIIGAPVLAE